MDSFRMNDKEALVLINSKKKKNVSVKEKQGEMCEQESLELKSYYFKTIPSFTACENANQ